MNPVVAVIVAIGVLLAISWLLRQPAAVRWQTLSRVLFVAGMFAVVLSLFSGRLHPAIAAVVGALLLLQRLFSALRVLDRSQSARGPSAGNRSRVSTRILEMSLDHDSGDMDGTVREGRFAGRTLSQLGADELLELLAQCRADDAQSAAVLEAYLDRMHGDGWRDRMGPDPHGQRATHPGGAMSEEEACDILGVSASADHDEIVAAHRRLMQKLHPDRGGSTYLAAKVNEARDRLLQRS